MLKLSYPIELKNNPSIVTVGESFGQKMIGNYQIMAAHFGEEELLHFVSAPPEYYLGENSVNSFVNINTNLLNNDVKMSLINNVLNRILLSESQTLTFQDRAFIEQTLIKLGIKDVKEFVRVVQNFKNETTNLKTLTNLYWNNFEEIRNISSEAKTQKEEAAEKRSEDESASSGEVHLHQEIFKRLGTALIYQEVRNLLVDSSVSSTKINSYELALTEQNEFVERNLLNRIKNDVLNMEQPLVYNKVNSFEFIEENEEDVTYQNTSVRLTEAVLSNVIDRLYSFKFDEINNKKDVWFDIAGAVYELTENTYERFKFYHTESPVTVSSANNYYENSINREINEINLIGRMLSENEEDIVSTREIERTTSEELREFIKEFGKIDEKFFSESNSEYRERFRTEIERFSTKDKEFLLERITDNFKLQSEKELIREELRKEIELVPSEPIIVSEEGLNEQELKTQIEIINEKNVENLNRLQEITKQVAVTNTAASVDRKKARKDALRALENPTEVLMEYLNAETSADREEERLRNERLKIYSPETIKIFEILEQYVNNPTEIIEGISVKENAEGDLLSLVHEIEVDRTREKERREKEVTVSSETKEIVKNLAGEIARDESFIRKTTEASVSEVELHHKINETAIDQETVEELIRENQSNLVREIRKEVEDTREVTTVHEDRTTTVNQIEVSNREDISRIVGEQLSKSIGSISDAVFAKFEKKMDRERRRRGL